MTTLISCRGIPPVSRSSTACVSLANQQIIVDIDILLPLGLEPLRQTSCQYLARPPGVAAPTAGAS